MNETSITTAPPSSSDKILREKFAESIAGQSEQMDRLGQQLIALELAIPGLYATALKLISGDKATLAVGSALYLTLLKATAPRSSSFPGKLFTIPNTAS